MFLFVYVHKERVCKQGRREGIFFWTILTAKDTWTARGLLYDFALKY